MDDNEPNSQAVDHDVASECWIEGRQDAIARSNRIKASNPFAAIAHGSDAQVGKRVGVGVDHIFEVDSGERSGHQGNLPPARPRRTRYCWRPWSMASLNDRLRKLMAPQFVKPYVKTTCSALPLAPVLGSATPPPIAQPGSQVLRLLRPNLTSRVRSLLASAPRLPKTGQPVQRLVKPEISWFPCKERMHMPVSSSTPGRACVRDCAPARVAFRHIDSVSTQIKKYFEAQ